MYVYKVSDTERGVNRRCLCADSHQCVEPGTLSGSRTWGQGPKHVGHFSLVPPRKLEGDWIGSEVARTETGARVVRGDLTHYTTVSALVLRSFQILP